jgi:hydroxymethylpyrimidine/phosphomethylpyrimidine kinase
MLASAESIEVVADAFRRYNVTTSVVDPVRQSNVLTRYIDMFLETEELTI